MNATSLAALASQLSLPALGQALLFGALGVLIGAAHFHALRLNVRSFLLADRPWRAIALQGARMGATAAALLGCALAGSVPLLSALAGLLLARRLALRRKDTT